MTEHVTMSLAEVFEESQTNAVIGQMRVSTLLESLPGVGKVRAQQLMAGLGVTARSVVRGLNANQRAALEHEFGSQAKVSVIVVDPDQTQSTVRPRAGTPPPRVRGDHLYTTSSAERDSAASVHGYHPEGVACHVFNGQQASTTPLHRLFNSASGDHLYTTSSAERDSAARVHGYHPEGVACHVFNGQQAGTTPLHRLFNSASGDHLYTTSGAERDSAVSVHGYKLEGVACYVFEHQQTGSTALYRLFRA
jgi:hypothetical protein